MFVMDARLPMRQRAALQPGKSVLALGRHASFGGVRPWVGVPTSPSSHRSLWPRRTARVHWTVAASAAPPLQHTATSPAGSSEPQASAAAGSAAAKPEPNPWQAARLALKVLAPDWPLAALTALTLVIANLTTLAFPLAIGRLFDVVKLHGAAAGGGAAASAPTLPALLGLPASGAGSTPPSFKMALLGLSVCMILSPLTNALVAYLSPLLAERFGSRLRKHLMEEVLRRDQTFFDHETKGALVSRLTLDVATLQATLADLLGQRGLRSLLEVAGPMIIIATKHPLMAVITCAVTPLLSRALRNVVVRSTELSYRRQRVASEALEFASDRLTHVQTVQVFGQEEREAAGFKKLAGAGFDVAQQYAIYQGLVEGAGRLAVNVGTVSLLGFGGMLVLQGKMTLGTLMAYMVFNLFISLGLSQLAASLGDVGKAIGALERISDLAADPSASSSTTSSTKAVSASGSREAAASHSSGSGSGSGSSNNGQAPATNGASSSNGTSAITSSSSSGGNGAHPALAGEVCMRDVWYRYQGREDWALKSLSLDIPPGSTLALVGPSGGGKSTVAALLMGLYQPAQGEVLIGGRPMRGQEDWDAVRPSMAAVLQMPMLMSGTVAQNIAYGRPDASFEEIVRAAQLANAEEFIRDLPQGYDTQVGERGHALSGGQKQRLAIARALICQPQVLVLDEVTSALDVESEVAIDRALAQLQGCTKLVIAHRLSTVRSADRIAVIVGGQVAESGTHEELMAKEGGVYQRLVLAAEL